MNDRQQVNILIEHGCVITRDPARRVMEDGAVTIKGDRLGWRGARPGL